MTGLARVLLIGDSIRLGYEPAVRRHLASLATVFGPAENGGDTRNVITWLDRWLEESRPDLVHLNAGLHDLRRSRDSGVLAVPLAEYAENVATILRALRERPGLDIVWATTTPVDDARHAARKSFDRREADVRAYNAAALCCCAEVGVAVHDLHRVIAAGGTDLLWDDGIHLSDAGYQVAAQAVAGELRRQIRGR